VDKSKKVALITGISGQDGSYLAELLLEKNYQVHGVIRRSSVFTTSRIDHIRNLENVFLHHGDVTDSSNLNYLIQRIQPDEVYHLAAQSHVGVSFEIPEYTAQVTGLGSLRLLNALRSLRKDFKFYNASTSEMFGGSSKSVPQSELTEFSPKSPYAIAKLYAHWSVVNFRESYDFFCVNGILFNHESPRRGETFVTRKTTIGVNEIINGNLEKLKYGNLDSVRDWGYAKEYVQAMWMMLQQDVPNDLVISTNKSYTVREFVARCFDYAGIEIIWEGEGVNEVGIDSKSGKIIVEIDERLFRPVEVEVLRGDSSKAEKMLKWKPETDLNKLISIMMDHDSQAVVK
jgi:GDPmannose 4,6-dehydratase